MQNQSHNDALNNGNIDTCNVLRRKTFCIEKRNNHQSPTTIEISWLESLLHAQIKLNFSF